MKILWIIDNLGSGGAQRQLVTIAKKLKTKEYDVEVLCYQNQDFFAKQLNEEKIPIYLRVESNYFKRILKVRQFVRKGNYDVVISFMDVPNFLNCIAAVGHKKWKVITNELSSKQSTFTSKRGKLFGWFQRYSDAIICNSHNAKNLWLKYFPRYKNKINVIYNPVLLPKVKSNYISRKDGKIHIVIAASYQYLKNPVGVVRALCLLSSKEREMINIQWYGEQVLSTGGTEPYNDALKLIIKNNLQNTICLNQATKDIAQKMAEADIVALFSKLEGLPNAICEGMMLGKPIIMTKVSDYKTLVDESNGFLCDWDDPQSIKDALVTASALNEKEIISMGKRSKEKGECLFSSEIITQQWINLFESE